MGLQCGEMSQAREVHGMVRYEVLQLLRHGKLGIFKFMPEIKMRLGWMVGVKSNQVPLEAFSHKLGGEISRDTIPQQEDYGR